MEIYVTVKGQILIPAALRRKYGIKNGTKIIVTDIGDGIVLKPVTEQYFKEPAGIVKMEGRTESITGGTPQRQGKREVVMAAKVTELVLIPGA